MINLQKSKGIAHKWNMTFSDFIIILKWNKVFKWACRLGLPQVALVVKNPPANAGDKRDVCLIPGLERSPGGGHGNLLQYSCLENPLNKGACQATAHRVTKSRRWLKWFSMHARKSINLRINLASKSCNYHRNLYS